MYFFYCDDPERRYNLQCREWDDKETGRRKNSGEREKEKMKIRKLRVQNMIDPLGIDTEHPLFSYLLEAEEKNQTQTACQILAASGEELLKRNIGDLWDSGRMEETRNFGIAYQGIPLESRQRVYWKVRVWDKDQNISDWSETAFWEMGLLRKEEWTAKWIGPGKQTPEQQSRAPVFRKQFFVEAPGALTKGRVYVSGLGLYRLRINGQEVSDAFFAPGESSAGKTVYYQTYDILRALRQGENELEVQLGNGQYTGFLQNPVMTDATGTELPPHRYQKNDGLVPDLDICGEKKFLLQMELSDQNGPLILIETDETWQCSESATVFQNWYGGEDYDALAAGKRCWKSAVYAEPPRGRLRAAEFPLIRPREKFAPETIRLLKNGNWLVDFGKNGAGFAEVILFGTGEREKGSWIRMYPAEVLREDGEGVDQSSSTQSWNEKFHCCIRDSYRIGGYGSERWHPIFCYHGFRYLEVEGFPGTPRKENFLYWRICTDNEKTGSFKSSDRVINAVNDMVERSMESNMFSAFTDCPQIEKLGWIETSHLMFRSLADTYDIRAWMRKIIHDIQDAQTGEREAAFPGAEPVGYVPAIVPEYQRIKGLFRDPNWNGACIFTPWEYYLFYGETDLLEQSYPSMKRYLEYLELFLKTGRLEDCTQMGEWGELGEHTPREFVAMAACYRMFRIVAKTAEILGFAREQQKYSRRAEELRSAFLDNPECWQEDTGICGTGSQASYGCALFSGLIPEKKRETAVERLVQAVEKKDFHLTSGEVGLKQVFRTLGEYGRSDVVWKMVMNRTEPSYRVFVDRGLTTLPEYWNYEELWYGMARSRNHAMMGHVKEWIMNDLLGIRLAAPGGSVVILQPYVPREIQEMHGKLLCSYGEISLSCQVKRRTEQVQVSLEITLPVGVKGILKEPYVDGNRQEQSVREKELGSGTWKEEFVFSS